MSDEDNNGLDTPADVSFVPKQLPAEYSGYKAGQSDVLKLNN